MESIDALGRQPERLASFTGSLLSEQEDVELQAIVAEAARDLSTPIALVNFVLEQVQFFKAHHGLPEDLAAARGTDRNVSFCQFVVRNGEPFEVEDAEKDDRVPKHLVHAYGIRSYLGMPIQVNGDTVGSLCVIDTKPRSFSETDRKNLRQLAGLVNSRLAILSENRQPTQRLAAQKKKYTGNSIEEIGHVIDLIKQEVLPGKSAAVAIDVFLRLMEYNSEHKDIPGVVIDQTLISAREALTDCREALKNIEISVDQVKVWMNILDRLNQLGPTTMVQEVLDKALALTGAQVEAVGGVQMIESPYMHAIRCSQTTAVSMLVSAISLLCHRLLRAKEKQRSGLKISANTHDGFVHILLHSALDKVAIADLARDMNESIGALEIGHTEAALLLRFTVVE